MNCLHGRLTEVSLPAWLWILTDELLTQQTDRSIITSLAAGNNRNYVLFCIQLLFIRKIMLPVGDRHSDWSYDSLHT